MGRARSWRSLLTVLVVLSACGGKEDPAHRSVAGNVLFRPFTETLRVLFVVVQYEDDEGPLLTEAQAQEHAAIVAESFETNSYGVVSVAIDVSPVLTMPRPGAFYEEGPSLVRLRADALDVALQAGFDPEAYDMEVIFGVVHWPTAASGIGALNGRTVFINRIGARLTVHEMGHAMGFGHANFLQSVEGSDREVLYADEWDFMGGGGGEPPDVAVDMLHFNPWFKYRSGWLDDDSVAAVTASGRFHLAAFEHLPSRGDGRLAALRIPKDAATDYWVFLRTDTGKPLAGPVVTLGARSHNLNIMQTRLLDMTPGSIADSNGVVLDWRDAGLGQGATFEDPAARIAMTVTSSTASEATVEVTLTRPSGPEPPSVAFVRPANGQVVQGLFDYLVTATDPGGGEDGAGIERVQMYLFNMFDDGMLISVRDGHELPETHYATTELLAPPYGLHVDTTRLEDGVYALVAVAASTGGEVSTMLAPHFIDNTGPSSAQ